MSKICIQKFFKSPVELITTAEALETVFNDSETYRKVCDVRKHRKAGDLEKAQQVKTSLPGLIFVADDFAETEKDGIVAKWRLQKSAHLNGLAVLDADHLKESPAQIFARWTPEQLKELGIYLIFKTSSDEGLKVVFKARSEWGNLIDNVRELGRILDLPVDESGKDASRMSFAPSALAGDILYFDREGMFSHDDAEYDSLFGNDYRQGNSAATKSDNSSGVQEFRISDYSYKGIPLQKIIDCWVGKTVPQEGERHKTSLLLADHLRYITDSNAKMIESILRAQPWVDAIVKERGENVAQTVKSALGYRESLRIPKRMLNALRAAGVDEYAGRDKAQLPYHEWARKLKKIQQGCYKSATAYIDSELVKPGGVITASGMYATLLTKCWYINSEGETQRLNCIDMIIGEPASGKGFAVTQDEHIMEVMRREDAPGRAAERHYKEAIKERGTSTKEQKKDALKRPTAIVRYCPVKTSNNVLYRRMQNAVIEKVDGELYYLHTYVFASELLSIVNASGSFQEKRDFYLHSFHNERNGVDYANGDSINDTMPVHMNVVATGTRTALKKFVNPQNIGDGLSTRMSCFVMPDVEFKMRPLAKKAKDMTAANEMKMWSERFNDLHGEIKGLDKLIKHVHDIVGAKAEEAYNSGDKVTLKMCMRMQDKIMVLCIPLVLSTQKSWEQVKQTMTVKITQQHLDFATLMFDVLLSSEDLLFGQLWQDYFDNEERDCMVRKIYDKTSEFFQQLPHQFTTQDVMDTWGYSSNSTASTRIKQMCEDGQVIPMKKRGHYQKLVSAI